jgi:tagaturonate reductase
MQAHGQYRVVIRGMDGRRLVNEVDTVSVISRVIDPYRQWAAFLETAHSPGMEVIITNTTEAGLVWHEEPYPGRDGPPQSVAGKITVWLWERYQAYSGRQDRGVEIVPCELIEQNGDVLRSLVQRYASVWGLPEAFQAWVASANRFYNTLVDSIVTAADDADERLGGDPLAVMREPFYRWIIQGPRNLAERWHLPVDGLSVDIVEDLRPYRELKVRVLNGAHTALAALGLLAGYQTVGEVMADDAFRGYLGDLLSREVGPTLKAFGLEGTTVTEFIARVFERFQNPYLHHSLADIQLQAVTKVRTRLLPSLRDSWQTRGYVPPRLTLAVAAQMVWLLINEGNREMTPDTALAQSRVWWDEPWMHERDWEAHVRVWLSRLLDSSAPSHIQDLLAGVAGDGHEWQASM